MPFHKPLLEAVRIFWLISKLSIGFIFLYCAWFVLEFPEMTDYFIAAFFVAFALALLWTFFAELYKGGAKRWIKFITGSITLLMAIGMIFITLNTFDFLDSYAVVTAISLYFLTGCLDFVNFRKNKSQVVIEEVEPTI